MFPVMYPHTVITNRYVSISLAYRKIHNHNRNHTIKRRFLTANCEDENGSRRIHKATAGAANAKICTHQVQGQIKDLSIRTGGL